MTKNNAALTVTTREASAPALSLTGAVEISSMADVFRLADALADADGFVPRHLLGKPGAIAATILSGIELGIGPMESMRVLHMVDGRVTMDATFMRRRALQAGIRLTWERTDERMAVLRLERGGAVYRQPWSIEEAQRAGLASKDNWRKYPADMLRARATSAGLRAFAPDVLGAGVYLRDEIDAGYSAPPAELPQARPVEVLQSAPHDEPAPTPAPVAALPQATPQGPPMRLAEVRDESELRDWCAANKGALAGIKNGRRTETQKRITEAAGRCGVDEIEALTWAGLADD